MAKLENNLKNFFLSMSIITVIVGAILGGVYVLTEAPIAEAAAAKQKAAITAVAPKFDTVGEAVEVTTANGEPAKIFPVLLAGEEVGKAVQVTTKKGFGGKIDIMFGFDMNGTITGYNVLMLNETPGLGSKMPDWFQQDGKSPVIGKNPGTDNLTVSKDGGSVDAITAATISTRAFCDAIAQAYGIIK